MSKENINVIEDAEFVEKVKKAVVQSNPDATEEEVVEMVTEVVENTPRMTKGEKKAFGKGAVLGAVLGLAVGGAALVVTGNKHKREIEALKSPAITFDNITGEDDSDSFDL